MFTFNKLKTIKSNHTHTHDEKQNVWRNFEITHFLLLINHFHIDAYVYIKTSLDLYFDEFLNFLPQNNNKNTSKQIKQEKKIN